MTGLGRILRAQGRSHRWLAAQLGVDASLVSRYVHGHRPIPSERARTIAQLLGVPVDVLFFDAESVPSGTESEPFRTEVEAA